MADPRTGGQDPAAPAPAAAPAGGAGAPSGDPNDKVMSYEEWDALYGKDFNKLLNGIHFKSQADLDAYKHQMYERYRANKGAALQDTDYQYGGKVGGAAEAAGQFQQRAGEALAQQQKFYGEYESDRNKAAMARSSQGQVANMMLARARGDVPSIAQQQADRQMGQLAAEQTSQAASARGPAGLALAQQNQANATATGQSAISGQAQINAAMERERAEQAAFGAYSGMRQGDYQGAQQGLQGAGQAGQQGLGYSGLQHGVNVTQLQARANKQGQESADKWAQRAQDERNRARQDAKDAGYMNAAATGGAAVITYGASQSNKDKGDDMTSDERAKIPLGGRSPGIAPGESMAMPSTYEQSRQAAHRELDRQEALEQKQRIYGTPPSTMPATYSGVEALDRYQAEKLALTRAKERHGVPLTPKEKMERVSQEYDEKREQKRAREGAAPPPDGVASEKPKGTDHERGRDRSKKDDGTAALINGGADAFRDLFARTPMVPSGNVYVPPTQQQITSDMGAKVFGPNVSDERAKDVGGWGPLSRAAKSDRMSLANERSEAVKRDAEPDMNGAWVKAMNEQAPHGGQPMYSDMGTKTREPMWSDDQTKLMKAWEQGRKSGLQEAEVGKAPIESDSKKAEKSAANRKRALTDAALASRRAAAPHPLERPGPVKDQSPAMGRAEEFQSSVGSKGASLAYNVLDGGQFTSQEPHELRQGGLAARIRASAASAQQRPTTPEPRFVPLGAATPTEYHEDQAEVYSDERTKRQLARADEDIQRVKVEDARMTKRGPLAGARSKKDDDMMRRADEMIASTKRDGERGPSVVDRGQPQPWFGGKRTDDALYHDAEHGPSVWDKEREPKGRNLDEYDDEEDDALSKTFKQEAPLARAARAQKGAPYAYKEEFRPPEQAPGEVNVGPMAQNMAKDPVASTAVRQDPNSGLLSLDRDKMLKMHGAVQASQQEEIDALKETIGRLTRAKKGRPS